MTRKLISSSATLLAVVVVAAVAVVCLMSTAAEGVPVLPWRPTAVEDDALASAAAAAKAKEEYYKMAGEVSKEALQQTQDATKSSAHRIAAAWPGPSQLVIGTLVLVPVSFLLYAAM